MGVYIKLPAVATIAFLAVSCAQKELTPQPEPKPDPEPVKYFLTTLPVEDVTSSSAVFKGGVQPEPAEGAEYGIQYSKTKNFDDAVTLKAASLDKDRIFSISSDDLNPLTEYFCRAYLNADKKVVFGDTLSFKTKDLEGFPLPKWSKGCMDIHFIAHYSGESLLIVYPDGTVMLIDAASDSSASNNPEIRAKWDAAIPGTTSKRPSIYICDYIRYFLGRMGKDRLDYVMLTHFHPDHMGTYHSVDYTGYEVFKTTKHPKGTNSSQWTIGGITEVMEDFTVGKLVDRGYSAKLDEAYYYPNLMYDQKKATVKDFVAGTEKSAIGFVTKSMMNNYKYMVRSIEDNGWSKIERYVVGSGTQFAPLYDRSYGVEVRNLGAGGEFWNGGSGTSFLFPKGPVTAYNKNDPTDNWGYDCPDENHESCCLKFTWGKFTFGTLGDNTYKDNKNFPWKDAEAPVSRHIGQCDLLKANHHGLDYCNGDALLAAAKPQVWVVDNWNDSQGDKGPVSRVVNNAGSDIYFTNMTVAIQQEIQSWWDNVKGYDGHVVVRVTDGGEHFTVNVLDYGEKDYKVKSHSVVYTSK